jgi:prepilin-type N-terminal cleavage/methylation domain-containing protein
MPARQNGFTLLELMIVITVMGTMAALLAPGIGEFMADARASSASEDLVRLSRHLAARTRETGLAHLLIFGRTSNDSGGLGRVRVYEGMNNHCRSTPWPQALAEVEDDGHAPIEIVDMAKYNFRKSSSPATIDDANRQVIALGVSNSLGAPDTAVICFEPSGATYEGSSATATSTGFAFTRQAKAIRFTVTRKVNGEDRGLSRDVLFPPGGIARFKF